MFITYCSKRICQFYVLDHSFLEEESMMAIEITDGVIKG